MGSMVKFDSERRELVRERREAQRERERERRQAREHKHARPLKEGAVEPSGVQQEAEQRSLERIDRMVEVARDRVPGAGRSGGRLPHTPAITDGHVGPVEARPPAPVPVALRPPEPEAGRRAEGSTAAEPAARVSRREREIAEFRWWRWAWADAARRAARERIAGLGEAAAVADALSATSPELAPSWRREREQMDAALAGGQIADVGNSARRALWAASRDAARSSQRPGRDPELALVVCVAYAIIARLPRTALRSAERERPQARVLPHSHRAFWR